MEIVIKTLAFVFVFGLLVVFHEFGHYIVARWMGVRVLSFSVGFGPVLWARTRGHTEYALRALPLGGYVRMLGDDPTAPVDDEIARDPESFHNKPVWRRMLIVVAGPVFNFILPLVVLFVAALIFDGRLLSARVGTPIAGGPAASAGLLPGDLIVRVAGRDVTTFDDLVREIGKRADQPTLLDIDRDGKPVQVTVTPREVVHAGAAEVGIVERVGRIQMAPAEQVPTIAVQAGSPLWQAGLRSGDRVREVGGKPVKTWHALNLALQAASGPVTVRWTPLREKAPVPRAKASQAMQSLHSGASEQATVVPRGDPSPAPGAAITQRWGAAPGHRLVGPVLLGGPESEIAGLLPGDEVIALDGAPVAGMEQLYDRLSAPYQRVMLDPAYRVWSATERVQRLQAAMIGHTLLVRRTLTVTEVQANLQWRAGLQASAPPPKGPWQTYLAGLAAADAAQQLATGEVQFPTLLKIPVTLGKDDRPDLALELAPLVDRVPPDLIENPHLIRHAFSASWSQFLRGSTLILATTAELFKGNVAVKEVGGVIRMAQMTSEATERGLERVLQLLAALSINLGILNLLPIPLVDGGHLLFLAIEGVRRQPASLRVRQVASFVGLAFLGMLFLVVMKNDLQALFAK